MRIKKVVKVMNFHALLRVDKSRKIAEKYFSTENELTGMIGRILYNRNLVLDKKTLKIDENNPILNIYIGNDYGFCGNFNSSINEAIKVDRDAYKIIVGKKIYVKDDKVILDMEKDHFEEEFAKVEKTVYDSLKERRYSEINVIHNHYYSISDMKFVRKRVFPIEIDSDESIDYNEDFVVETDINKMLEQLVALYICYEIRICFRNSNASENIMRQGITKESLKRIDEIDAENARLERKEKSRKSFEKTIENARNL